MYHVPLPPHLTRRAAARRDSREAEPEDTTPLMADRAPPPYFPDYTANASAPPLEQPAPPYSAPDAKAEAEDRGEFWLVPVSARDSVVSVAVQWGVSEAELRSFNPGLLSGFPGCDFVSALWVPKNPRNRDARLDRTRSAEDEEANRRYMLRKEFTTRTGASEEEAQFYLDETSYRLEPALKAWGEDIAWERANGGRVLPNQRPDWQRRAAPPAPAPAARPASPPAKGVSVIALATFPKPSAPPREALH